MPRPLRSVRTMTNPINARSATEQGSASRAALLVTPGRLPYDMVWQTQRAWVEHRLRDRHPDALLLLEHDPIITMGRRTTSQHREEAARVIAAHDIPLLEVDRGGSITYHGPGQLVAYPIVRLAPPCYGPKAYVARLETIVIRTLAEWGIEGFLRPGLHGVWVSPSHPLKIASIGVRIVKGVTMHGLALNVSMDLTPFRWITPCGVDGCKVTSMAELLGRAMVVNDVRTRLAHWFAVLFQWTWLEHRWTLHSPLERLCHAE
ncbi:MAG: lipoyl(octanoyl) transferase LipB [Nitrospiraceae bacterium]